VFLKKLTYTTWGLLILAITLMFVTLNNVKKENEYDWTQQFEQEGTKNTRILKKQLENIARELIGVASLFRASKTVTRSGFKAYTSLILEKNDFIKSLKWIPRVKQGKRLDLELMAQNEGFIDFKFTALSQNSKVVRAPIKNEYYPIFFIESHSGKEEFLGFDISTQSDLKNLMNEARDTGETVASSSVSFFNKHPKGITVLFFSPFYKEGFIPKTIKDRRLLFSGVVMGTYNTKSMIKKIIHPYLGTGMFLTVFDEDHKNELFGKLKESLAIKNEMELRFSKIHWFLVWQGNSKFQNGPNKLHYWLSAAVLVLIVFFAIIFQILSSRARRIESEVQTRTNELKKIKNILEEKNFSLHKLIKVKNELLGMASHDIRNPLTSIKGYSGFLLKKGTTLNEDTRNNFLKIINSASCNILELLNDLLSLSAIESGKLTLNLQTGNIRELIEERIELYDHLALEKKIRFKVNSQETTLASFDRPRIGQVLDNLLTNAIKFSPEGGTIEIGIKSVKGNLRVSVTDEGPGIKSEDLEILFQPFKKSDSDSTNKGTGLGLAIAKKMIELHGGTLTFIPSQNQGASLSFELPENSPPLPT
jgi:signal transduction histidine kinase